MDFDFKQIQKEFADYNREVTVSNFKVACILGIVLVPLFFFLDYTVYPEHAAEFLRLRLLCSALIGAFLSTLLTSFGRRNSRVFGLILLSLPTTTISYMIYQTTGADSPYYAGLNLVLLVLGFVLRWTSFESAIAVGMVTVEYLLACRLHGPIELKGVVIYNLFFLVSTGIIVVTGNHVFSRLRFREFALRYELDKNRKALEQSLQQLKENEMQLVQSEKLASLGRMSAGIIHEINNPLNFATTGLFTLRNKAKYLVPEQQGEYTEILKDVEEGVSRVKTIVSDLRMLTHPETESRDDVEMEDVVKSALRFLSNEWKDRVEIEQALPPHQTVRANKNKMIQVMVNLLQNALDAMKTKHFNGEKPAIRISGSVENGYSSVFIRDNGPGIDSKNVDKIFDPFFTTKDVGEGMGLGLSICYRIIQECEGRISVKTEPGKFCEFTLEFPAKK